MNKKKIILSMLGLGICFIPSNVININASAETVSEPIDSNFELPGQSDNAQIDFSESQDVDLYNPRPDTGEFKSNTIHKGNPDVGGALKSTFSDLSGHSVQTGLRTDYDFDMLFYIPTDFAFDSPGVSVPENYYSTHSGYHNFDTGWTDKYYKRKKDSEGDHYWKRTSFDMMSHFDPTWSKWIYEDNPKYDDDDDDPIYNFYGEEWEGSNSNSSNIAIQPNTSDNRNGTKAKWYDDKFDRKLEWRYLGYSMQGRALGNPYFPSDSDSGGAGFDRGYMGARLSISNPTDYDSTDTPALIANKKKAIQSLMNYDTSFNSARSYATDGGSRVNRPDADTWARGLSLITNPIGETPVFKLITASGGYSYVVAPPAKDLTGDMVVTKMTEYDSSGKLIGQFTRDENGTSSPQSNLYGIKDYSNGSHSNSVAIGNTYTVKVTVKNTNRTALQINPAKLDIGTAINAKARLNDWLDKDGNFKNSYYEVKTVDSKERVVSGGGEATFEYEVTVPETANETFRITSFVNEQHRGIMPSGQVQAINDDKFTLNDWSLNRFNIYNGDFTPSNILLIDKNGNQVAQDAMKPGEDYKVRWEYTYNGPDRDKSYDLYFSGDIKRYLPQGLSDTKHYDWKINKKLKNADKITFDSDYITFEIPKIDVSSNVNGNGIIGGSATDDTNKLNKYFINENTTNDSATKSWFGSWDIKISNLSVYPINERPLKDEYITVGIKYDATLTAPSSLRNSGLEFDTTDTITIPNANGGTQNLVAHTHLKEGTNKNVTQIVQVPVKAISSGSKSENIEVWLNSDRRKYEDDLLTQSNNHASTSVKVLPPNNPNNFNTNGNSFGCPIDSSNENDWDVTHQTLEFDGDRKNYWNFQNGNEYSFFYYENPKSYDSETLGYNESYKIDYVKFKSKFTTDKNYGDNGWVNLMDSSQKDYAKIKAGYGYELDIQTTYHNDVFGRQPAQTWDGKWR